MSSGSSRTQLVDKLPQLQNLVKRDPSGYADEFRMQHRHYQSELQRFDFQSDVMGSSGATESDHFVALVSFLSHVATCYRNELAEFPTEIMNLLVKQAPVLEGDVRRSLTQSLILLRNRNLVDPLALFRVFFKLFRVQDKRLRELMYNHMVSDLNRLYKKAVPQKLTQSLQSFVYSQLVQEADEVVGKTALKLLVDMYRKRHWTDQKTVNVIASVACSPSTSIRLSVSAIQFFLGIDHDILADEEEEEAKIIEQVDVDYHSHSKKTKSRKRQTRRALIQNRKARQRNADNLKNKVVFPALELLNDPQGIVEKQFRRLKGCNERFEVKLLMMNFIAQILGCHQLVFLGFYTLLQRYLSSHQSNVTQVLAYLIQSIHDEIPPEELLPIVKTICTNFVNERCDETVICVGLNTLREMFSRVPLLLESEGMDDLVSDLIMYNKSKDKGVVMASRSVLNTIRDIHPVLLAKKHRGKFYSEKSKPKAFGDLTRNTGVDGIELLERAEAEGRFADEENGDGWEVTSGDDDDDAGSWVDLSSDEENEDNDVEEFVFEDEEETVTEAPVVPAKDRLDAKRILTPRDFERIAMLKKEELEASKDPKLRSKKRQREAEEKNRNFQLEPESLESYSKKKRMTQEERMLTILKGREEFQHRKSGGGTTNTEKERKKHFLMLRKSRAVQSKVKLSARQVQSAKSKVVKKILNRDAKKRRRL